MPASLTGKRGSKLMNSAPSAAAQVLVTVIPIVGISTAGIVVFFWLLWHHRRTSLLIRSGLYQKTQFDLDSFSLLTGLLLTFIGTALTLFLSILEGKSLALLGGLIPLATGAALLVFHGVRRHERKS